MTAFCSGQGRAPAGHWSLVRPLETVGRRDPILSTALSTCPGQPCPWAFRSSLPLEPWRPRAMRLVRAGAAVPSAALELGAWSLRARGADLFLLFPEAPPRVTPTCPRSPGWSVLPDFQQSHHKPQRGNDLAEMTRGKLGQQQEPLSPALTPGRSRGHPANLQHSGAGAGWGTKQCAGALQALGCAEWRAPSERLP